MNLGYGSQRLRGPLPARLIQVVLIILLSLAVMPFMIVFYMSLGLLQVVISMIWFYNKLVLDNWSE